MSPSLFGAQLLGGDNGEPTDIRAIAGRFDGEHVLAPLLSDRMPAITDQLNVAVALARPTDAALSVMNPISAPDQTPKTYGPEVADDDDALLEWALDRTAGETSSVGGGFLYTRDVISGVLSAVGSRDVDTLVLPNECGSSPVRKGLTKRIAAHANCDVVVVNGQAGYDRVASILLPVAGGPHSGLAADIARSIAADCDAWIDVLHVIDEDASFRRRERAAELVEDVSHRIARPENTTTWILDAAGVADAIIEQSRYYGLTVLGAPTKGRLRRFVSGSTNRSVRANARSVVLSARNNSHY